MQYFYLCCIYKVNACQRKEWKNRNWQDGAGKATTLPGRSCTSAMLGECSACAFVMRATVKRQKTFDSFDKFTWRGDGSLRAWMERVMVNTALQYLRKNDVINQSEGLDNVPETYEEPDASTVDTIPQKVLMQFISELPVGYRTVFNLYIFEDKSHREIAQMLGINEKSSASQLTRAKATLATKVREWMKNNA